MRVVLLREMQYQQDTNRQESVPFLDAIEHLQISPELISLELKLRSLI